MFLRRSFTENKNKEDLAIREVITTPFEKCINIIKEAIKFIGSENKLAKDLDWVIKTISDYHLLYSYKGIQSNFKNSLKKNKEYNTVLEVISEYSEKDNFIVNPQKKHFQTLILNSQNIMKNKKYSNIFENLKNDADNDLNKDNSNKKLSDEENKFKFSDSSSSENDNEDDEEQNEKLILYNVEPSEVENIGKNLDEFTFNIFDYYEKYKENSFEYASQIIFSKYKIFLYSSEKILYNFVKSIKENYSKIPYYHTEKHAIDLLQTLNIYLTKTNLIENINLNNLDITALLVGGLCHDVGHPGYNNDFQIKMHTDLAITYNDKSVLENYHISLTYKILQNEDKNIFLKLDRNDFSYIRKRIIELILSTDMVFHGRVIALMKNIIETYEIISGMNANKIIQNDEKNLTSNFNTQQDILNFFIHMGDISHSSKDFKISYKWTQLLTDEFWRQGDNEKEKGFNVSVLFDRNEKNIYRGQIGFLKGIVQPGFLLMVELLPELVYYLDNVYKNIDDWKKLAENFEKKEKEEKEKEKNNKK